ncbi:hypothetical protein PtrM4_030260 [Pyrenophora tritici-repentis]|uniref:Uncharacterized protein n=1 Tax=Pyrenophora tritici-repentis TaxID=45151 RepID=A0A834SAF9_9PLEO|nr:hypothetical protein PtrM4_030260 [Pyrenophora tritici-repentis]KAI0588759.1 hypothetical protein Alg215_00686 [Pyrenophora tritici-repentis]
MNMETTQPQEAQKTAASKASPLKRHPIVQAVPSSPPMVTQTIFLDHPSARLSSSPASSPRIVEPSPTRRGSVHPVMSETMERGLLPGADFFDDGSSDSEWEDSEGDITQIFSLDERYSLRSPPHAIEDQVDSAGRGRSRERSTITSLPHLSGLSSLHDPGLGIRYNEANGEKIEGKGPKRARQMSLRRLNMDNIRVVQTGSRVGTPRESLRSAGSDAPSLAHVNQPFPHSAQFRHNEDAPTQHSPTSKRRYRRNTSESMIADSIINAHAVYRFRPHNSITPFPVQALNPSLQAVISPFPLYPSPSIAARTDRPDFPLTLLKQPTHSPRRSNSQNLNRAHDDVG